MPRHPATTVGTGALATLIAFSAGHFTYQYGNQTLGLVIGMLAMVPLGVASLVAWRRTGKAWAKALFWTVAGLWVVMMAMTAK
jgi:hypothetical protein